jgi:YVTN family beta-propeller protein
MVLDVATHAVTDTIDVGMTDKPVDVVVSPDGSRLYSSLGGANAVAVIDAETKTIIERIPVGPRPWGIDITNDGRRVYSANGPGSSVSVIDTEAMEVIATVDVGEMPWGVAIAQPRGGE